MAANFVHIKTADGDPMHLFWFVWDLLPLDQINLQICVRYTRVHTQVECVAGMY